MKESTDSDSKDAQESVKSSGSKFRQRFQRKSGNKNKRSSDTSLKKAREENVKLSSDQTGKIRFTKNKIKPDIQKCISYIIHDFQ